MNRKRISILLVFIVLLVSVLYLGRPFPDEQTDEGFQSPVILSATTADVSAPHIAEPQSSVREDVMPTFTKESLARYDGTDPLLLIYIALEGRVYDVTGGRKHYEPGGNYHFLAGTDATIMLRIMGGDIIKQKYPVVGSYTE